jgi:hypothetical protein
MARYDPQVGHWSYWTQAIGNAFPHWHAARKNPIGRTQTFLNVAGIGIEGLHRSILEFRRNAYLETANLFQPSSAFRVPVSRPARVNTSDFPRRNLLYNPDFSISGPARTKIPLGWDVNGASTTGVVDRYAANAFTGTGCVRFTADNGEDCYLQQEVTTSDGGVSTAANSVTGSIWVLLPYTASSTSIGQLQVTINHADGTSSSGTSSVPEGTGGGWRRVSVTLTTTKRIQSLEIQVLLDNDSGSTKEMFIDAAQLEFGKLSPWTPNAGALPHWFERPSLGPVFAESVSSGTSRTVGSVTYDEYVHNRIWLTPWVADWWERALPTRVGTLAAYAGSEVGTEREIWGFNADVDTRERRTMKYTIADNRLKLVDAVTPVDVYYSFKIAERWFDNDGFDRYAIWDEEPGGYTVTFEAFTIHRDRIWLIVKEVYNSTTYRTLKIVRPSPSGWVLADDTITDYLEVLADFDTGLNTGTCTSVRFADGNENLLLLTIDASEYSLDVFYDYAFFDPNNTGSLLLRHAYTGDTLVLT